MKRHPRPLVSALFLVAFVSNPIAAGEARAAFSTNTDSVLAASAFRSDLGFESQT